MPTLIRARLIRIPSIALLILAVGAGCKPPFKADPVSFRLERADQLIGAAHRHTVWINGENAGLIRNGATNAFNFIPRIDQKNAIYIEGYDPFLKNPVSNTVFFNIGSGGELTGTVKWEKNGSGIDLLLELSIVQEGKYPPAPRS